jgi:putative ABC transport system permease protein
MFLLMIAIALGHFSASFAETLDSHYIDASYYRTGADLALEVQWERIEQTAEQSISSDLISDPTLSIETKDHILDIDALIQEQMERLREKEKEEQTLSRWRYPPFEPVYTIPQVEGAARVLRTEAYLEGAAGQVEGTLLGINRLELPQATKWRKDFASVSMGALMNTLAQDSTALLVSRNFVEDTGLQLGDELFLVAENADKPIYFTIQGVVDYFPTLYPEEGFFFVGNLDYIYAAIGTRPYDIWLDLSEGTPSSDVVERLRQRGFLISNAKDTRLQIASWRIQPQSTALFGMLSIGFIVATVTASLAFLLHSFRSLQKRVPHFGILRALGLSVRQVTVMVVFEEFLLGGLGAVGGSAIGALTSNLFIPLLQVGSVVQGTTPPFLVTPAWDQMFRVYVCFGVIFLIVVSVLMWQLARLRIHEAIKLGGLE